jgi:predicted ester cyclase
MSPEIEELVARAQRAWEEALKGNLDALGEIYAADVISRGRRIGELKGLAALKEFVADGRLAFSDQTLTFDHVIAEGDRAAFEWTWRARHTGQSPTLSFPPTGKEVTIRGCTVVVRGAGDEAIEESVYVDNLNLLQQIGAVPQTG